MSRGDAARVALCLLFPALAAAAPDAGTPGPPAGNVHLATGFGLFEQGLLDESDVQLREAFASEIATAADRVSLQVLDGMLRAVSADDDLARAAFGRALQLDPAVVLPSSATTRVRRLFEQVKREREARAGATGPSLASQVAKLSTEGKLDGAEALVVGARPGASKAESGQLLVLKGLVLVLKGLKSAGTAEADQAKAAQGAERQLQVAEQQLQASAAQLLSESDSAQQLVLKGMLLMVKGLVKAEAGDEAQAKAAFAQALELDPGAQLPSTATPRAQKLFEAAKAAVVTPPPVAPAARGVPGEVARLYAEGKLERAELLLARRAERTDLSKAESGQLFVMKGLLLVLKGLQKAGPREQDRAKAAFSAEGELKAVEEQLAATGRAPLTEAESSQLLVLKGLVLMVKGLVRAESGKEAQAKAAFAEALALDPEARLPSMGAPKVQKLFEATRASAAAAAAPEPGPLPERLSRLYADGRLERAELVLAESGERANLTQDQSSQLFVLKGLLRVLKGLQAAGSDADRVEAARSAAPRIEEVEKRLASTADAPLAGPDAAQRHLLEGLALVIKGLAQAEAGDEERARESFERGLALAPGVQLPAVAGPRARQLFESVRAANAGGAELRLRLWPGRPPPALALLDGRASPARWAGAGLGAGGVVLLAGGAASGIVALSAVRAEQSACAAGAAFECFASRDRARKAINLADGLYIGGAVAFAAGTFLLWQTRDPAASP